VMAPLLAFGRFEVGRLLRSWKFLVITVGFPVTFYMLFLGNQASGTLVGGTVAWRAYLMVTMCSFGALVAGLTAGGARLSAERASGWARQLRVTPIPGWSYVVTKVVASMLVILPVMGLVDIVGAAFGGVQLSVANWVGLTAVMWVSALPFALLGVLVGYLVTAETAFPVVIALMFVLGYFGGLFDPLSNMPSALQAAARALPSYHNASLGMTFLDGQGWGAQHWVVLAGYAVVLSVAIMLKHRVEEGRGLA
jgi:ABC-2 type transport system permease protein